MSRSLRRGLLLQVRVEVQRDAQLRMAQGYARGRAVSFADALLEAVGDEDDAEGA